MRRIDKDLKKGTVTMTARAENTRNKILVAAELEFSEKGLYGARVDEIAMRAGINKRMLYAHFGSKEQLYVAVIELVYERLARFEEPLLQRTDGSAEQQLRTLIHSYFAFLSQTPSFVRIVMWENLGSAQYLRASNAMNAKGVTLELLRKTLQTGVKNREFRADIDLEEALLSINLFCFSYFSNMSTLTQITQTDLAQNTQIRKRADHVADVILKYLK